MYFRALNFIKSDEKIIKIDAYDHTNRETITNASFKVQIFNDNQLMLDEWFYTQDGNLILKVEVKKKKKVTNSITMIKLDINNL